MANLAELNLMYEAWVEGLRILEAAGHSEMVQNYHDNLVPDHPFRK